MKYILALKQLHAGEILSIAAVLLMLIGIGYGLVS